MLMKIIVSFSLMLFLTLGDASGDSSSSQVVVNDAQRSEESLRKRVSGRWDALASRDFAAAYEYLSPAYRKLFPVDGYTSRFGSAVAWEGVDVRQVTFNGKSAEVVVDVSYQLIVPPEAGMPQADEAQSAAKSMNESWLWRDGEWWFVDF